MEDLDARQKLTRMDMAFTDYSQEAEKLSGCWRKHETRPAGLCTTISLSNGPPKWLLSKSTAISETTCLPRSTRQLSAEASWPMAEVAAASLRRRELGPEMNAPKFLSPMPVNREHAS